MQAYGSDAEAALKKAQQSVCQLEEQFSVTNEESKIYAVNHSRGKPVTISADTMSLLRFALTMAQETDGALDPTIYPALTAWGFTTDEYHVPSHEELDALLPLINHEAVSLTDTTVTIPDGMELDLGAVAKGYIGDRAAKVLREHGIVSALINMGGNVQVVGAKPDGSPWRVGVRNPFSDDNLGVMEIKDMAVVTSGGYERYFTDEAGNVYWHILDPSTGYPADSDMASVTVIAPDGKLCDALSTALFVMGTEEAISFWRERQDFEILMVGEDGTILLSEGLKDTFTASPGMEDVIVTVIRQEAE